MRCLVLIIAKLKPKGFTRLTVQLNYRLNINKVRSRTEAGSDVVNTQKGDSSLRSEQPAYKIRRHEIGADNMAARLAYIMAEMRRVPDHHVLISNRLAINEAIDVGLRLIRISGEDLSIIDLDRFESNYPQVANAETVSYTVFRSRNEQLTFVGHTVLDVPFS